MSSMMIQVKADRRRIDGWVRLRIRSAGRSYQAEAKVYDVGDGAQDPEDYKGYGVRVGSRVSKLVIRGTDRAPLFSWDRGPDFDVAPAGLVDAVVNFCDALPLVNPDFAAGTDDDVPGAGALRPGSLTALRAQKGVG